MENPIKIDDLGGFYTPIFGSTPIYSRLPLFQNAPVLISPFHRQGQVERLHLAQGSSAPRVSVRMGTSGWLSPVGYLPPW